ncbi:MAG: T9SS type A sorting domain-containing protein [Flavobacteriaceae bacterium]|nr:T9SS type A sorting domain-containing protein [Flavobacteriaceae bacterium]
MKKKYTFATLLLILFFFFSTTINSQIRFTKVDPVTDVITIHNYGSTSVDISNYQICRRRVYKTLNLLTINSGSLTLQAGSDVVLSSTALDATSSDLGLYLDSNFTSPSSMLDYLQWGTGGFSGRESVAVAKGIWTSGTFLGSTGPYFYNGNGTQNGMSFWSNTVLGIKDIAFGNQTYIYPNPTKNSINIKNGSNQKIIRTELFDILGKQIILNRNLVNSISLSKLSSGIYYIRLTGNLGAVSYKKIIKN